MQAYSYTRFGALSRVAVSLPDVASEVTPAVSSDPLQVLDVAALSSDEAAYVAAARAANTLRGYRSDWAEWCAWARANGHADMPAAAEGISRYLHQMVDLLGSGGPSEPERPSRGPG